MNLAKANQMFSNNATRTVNNFNSVVPKKSGKAPKQQVQTVAAPHQYLNNSHVSNSRVASQPKST